MSLKAEMVPSSLPPSGAAGGDLTGTYPNPTIAKIQGVAISGVPSANQVLTASDSTHAAWATISSVNPNVGVATAVNLKGSSAGSLKTATFTADELTVETALGGTVTKLASVSLSFNGGGTGAGGMDTGGTPTSADLYIYAIYNGTTASCLGTTSGSGATIYGGANMPATYTQSALIWAGVTDSSAKLAKFQQYGRRISIIQLQVMTNQNGKGSFTTGLSLTAAVPINATNASGSLYQTSDGSNNIFLQVAAASTGDIGCVRGMFTTGTQVQASSLPFADLALPTAQTMYWYTGNTIATSASMFISGYLI